MTNADQEYRRPLPFKTSPADIPDYSASDRKPGHDGEPPVFGVRKDFVYADGKRTEVESPENVNHSRVKWLHSRDLITLRQYLAAERLAKDWELSLIQPFASSVLVGGGSSAGDNHPNDAKRAAMQRRGDAMEAVGRRLSNIVEKVVIENKSVGKASAELRLHNQAGAALLDLGLDILADHYGLT